MLDLHVDQNANIEYFKWDLPDPDIVFLLIHGMGAHSERWAFFANYFQSKNIASYSLELKGFGQTTTYKGHIDSLSLYYKEIAALIDIIQKEHPNKKIVIVGESMGGLIAFEYFASYGINLEALICFSPAFGNKMKLNLFSILFSLLYNPKKQFVMPFTSAMCTRDQEYQKIMDSDIREHRFATSNLLLQLLFAQIRSLFFTKRINKPVLFLLAEEKNDLLVNTRSAKKVFNNIKSSRKKLIEYPSMLHALSIDLGKEKVFEDIYFWLKEINLLKNE